MHRPMIRRRPFAARPLPMLLLALAVAAPATAERAGSLEADPNPCTNLIGENYCTPELDYSSSGLGADTPYVQITFGPDDTRIVCPSANTTGSHQLSGVKVRQAGKTFRLWATSDCTDNPFNKILLAETFARNSDPQGRIWADPNPCLIAAGETVCKPTIHWDSLNVDQPKVIVGINGVLFACGDANDEGSKTLANFGVGSTTRTFGLYEVASCSTPSGSWGTPLATVDATSYPAGTILCRHTNEPLDDAVDPAFFGIIENFRGFPTSGPIDDLADELAAADTAYLRRTIRWVKVHPTEPTSIDEGDWGFYETLLGHFVTAGIEPWLTLSDSAPWAVPLSVSCDRDPNSNAADACWRYPADPEIWREFVAEAVDRFGDVVDNWEVWQEPDTGHFLGTPEEYVELLDIAYEEIKAADPTDKVWAPNGDFWDAVARESLFHELVDEVLAEGDFDGLAIHIFYDDMARTLHAYDYARNLLDATASQTPDHSAKPIAVTAVSYSGCDVWATLGQKQKAAELQDRYVCLANAGAAHAMWFNATDRNIQCGSMTVNEDKGVVVEVLDGGTIVDFAPKQLVYDAYDAIGEALNAP